MKLRLHSTKAASQSILYFDTIAKQRRYNFDQLVQLDDKSVPVLRSNLDKLYRSILKQLRIFHAETNIEVKLQGVLSDVKLLQDKGLIKEAKKLNAKLIKYAAEEEQFHILKKAVSNQWILLHLSGMLTIEATNELEEQIDRCRDQEIELDELNKLYRKGVSIYYSYFFQEKKSEYQDNIKRMLDNELIKYDSFLHSANAQMVYYEIKSLCRMVLGDLQGHHKERKKQLELLFSSSVFEKDYINKLLVMSNVFTYLKIGSKLEEFGVYLDVFERYFSKVIKNSSDSVLIEKFYDVYFQNKIYQQHFNPSQNEVDELVFDFKDLVEEKKILNKLLISRTYLSLSELLIVADIEKRVIPLLIEYQDWDKMNKSSKSFIDSELLFMVIYWKRKKIDSLESKMNAFKKFIKTKSIKLDYDQMSVLNVIEWAGFGAKKPKVVIERIKKPVNKIILDSIVNDEKFSENAKAYFKNSEEVYNSESDSLMSLLKTKV